MPDSETNATDTNHDEIHYFHQLETLIPTKPIIDDDTAIIAAYAVIELVARRTPEALGDNLAELHALTSLLHQLNDWINPTITDALDQHHNPSHILALLTARPAPNPRTPTPTISTDDPPRRRHVHNETTLTTQQLSSDDSR